MKIYFIIFLSLLFLMINSCQSKPSKTSQLLTKNELGQEIILNEFPDEKIEKIVAYKMTGAYGDVIEDGKISDKVIGKGEILTDIETKELLNIFRNQSTYGDLMASCFEPHVGYVSYGKKDKILGHSTICLACNWMKINPDIGEFAFSSIGEKKLAEIENKIFNN